MSPTSLAHAVEELKDYLDQDDLALDGAGSRIGVESTIIDATGPEPIILRHGGVTAEDIETIIHLSGNESYVRAPGTLASHYTPKKQLVLTTEYELRNSRGGALIAMQDIETPVGFKRIASPENADQYAHILYSALREADKSSQGVIYAIPPTGGGIAAAIRDRLNRAATQ